MNVMKQSVTRILSVILMSLMLTDVFAYDIEVENTDGIKLYYSFINNSTELMVTSGDTKASGNVVIPEEIIYDGITYKVTCIGKSAFLNWDIEEVTIPNSVITIEDYAFYGCEISNVTIPNSVTSIGESAFENAYSLRIVTIGSGVTSIGRHAFFRNGGWPPTLEIVVSLAEEPIEIIGKSNEDDSPFNEATFENAILYVPAGTTNKYEATKGWQDFDHVKEGDGRAINYELYNGGLMVVKGIYSGDVVIPEEATYMGQKLKVIAIGEEAFSRCGGLTSVTLPNTLTSIGEFAFEGCSGLTSIIFPNSLTTIEHGAFWGCTGLTSISIPGSVTAIGGGDRNPFLKCNLTSIKVEEGNTVYDSRYNCNAIIETKSNTLVTGCRNTVIPNDVTTIGYGSFICPDLTSITIPNSVISIETEAFSQTNLTSVVIPNSVTSIGNYAFSWCDNLTSITIGSGVTSIGWTAFFNPFSTNLKTVVSLIQEPFEIDQESVQPTFSENILQDATLYVPVGSIDKYKATKGWKEFVNIVEINPISDFTNNEATYVVEEGNTVSVSVIDQIDGHYEIPEIVNNNGVDYFVTAIADHAFENQTGLTAITIPATIASIGERAFAGCVNLNNIYSYAIKPAALGSSTSATRSDGASSVFDQVNLSECVLSVPNGCVEAYQTAEGWKEFTHIVEMGSSHINGIITNDNAFDVYSISGCKVRTQTTTIEDLPKGVYIINGRKVVKRQ